MNVKFVKQNLIETFCKKMNNCKTLNELFETTIYRYQSFWIQIKEKTKKKNSFIFSIKMKKGKYV